MHTATKSQKASRSRHLDGTVARKSNDRGDELSDARSKSRGCAIGQNREKGRGKHLRGRCEWENGSVGVTGQGKYRGNGVSVYRGGGLQGERQESKDGKKSNFKSGVDHMDFNRRYEQVFSQFVSIIKDANKWCTL